MRRYQIYQWRNDRQGVWAEPGQAGWCGSEQDMIPRLNWGMFAIQWFLAILLFVHSSIVAAQEGVCAKFRIKILQTVSLERQAFDAILRIRNGLTTVSSSTTIIITKFVVSHFFRQSKLQFKYSNKVACCEPMSHWSQDY
jgi:hypothetical protein